MNEKTIVPQKVPETNSPAPVEKDKYIDSAYRDVSAPQEQKNKLIYECADLIYTGEK